MWFENPFYAVRIQNLKGALVYLYCHLIVWRLNIFFNVALVYINFKCSMAFSKMTLSIMTLSIMTLSIMTLSIMYCNDMLNVIYAQRELC